MSFNREAFFEAVKEPLRLLVLAVIPFLITFLTELPNEWAVGAVVVLRFLDKWMHEVGKAVDSESISKGITRF
jgi:hypothetical protein